MRIIEKRKRQIVKGAKCGNSERLKNGQMGKSENGKDTTCANRKMEYVRQWEGQTKMESVKLELDTKGNTGTV